MIRPLIFLAAGLTALACDTNAHNISVGEPDGGQQHANDASSRPDSAALPDQSSSPDQPGPPDAATSPDQTVLPDQTTFPDQLAQADQASLPDQAALPDQTTLPDQTALPDQAALPDQTSASDAATGTDAEPPPASEMLLFDGAGLQFTESHRGFLPLISPGDSLPASDWTSPVDYYNGEFRIRYIITAPPDQAPGRLQVCIWTMGDADGDGRNYFPESCSGQPSHDGVGEFYNDRLTPASWWELEGVPLDFSHPERFLIRVVLRGASGCNVTNYNVSNGCWDEWPLYQDMVFRVTIVMVGAGETFSGWTNYP